MVKEILRDGKPEEQRVEGWNVLIVMK